MKTDRQPSNNFEREYYRYKNRIEQQIKSSIDSREPVSVYAPIRYILGSGGKRFRAVLTLLSCEAVGGTAAQALNAGAAIEILHNFTLVHDDVMDHADLRRGKPTVHNKWDENTAILAGDEMIAQAYRVLLRTSSPRLKKILDVYTDALVQVCEGQGFDKEFEAQRTVGLEDYFEMISKKTGRVIAAAAEMGALIGGGTTQQVIALRKFGECIGIAFQVMDDLLDIVGKTDEFGKKIGGDIREGKKTYLLLKALEQTRGYERKILRSIVPGNKFTQSQIGQVRVIYQRIGVFDSARNEIARSTSKAQRELKKLPAGRASSVLFRLAEQLLERSS
jgi:geranylgeranyl diphosphate synthase type II